MTVLLQALTGFAVTVVAPFLIQFLKKKTWKAWKARWFAIAVSTVIAVTWVLLSGVAGTATGMAWSAEWFGWLIGSAVTVFAAAHKIYTWFEETIFKKLPNFESIVASK